MVGGLKMKTGLAFIGVAYLVLLLLLYLEVAQQRRLVGTAFRNLHWYLRHPDLYSLAKCKSLVMDFIDIGLIDGLIRKGTSVQEIESFVRRLEQLEKDGITKDALRNWRMVVLSAPPLSDEGLRLAIQEGEGRLAIIRHGVARISDEFAMSPREIELRFDGDKLVDWTLKGYWGSRDPILIGEAERMAKSNE